MDDQLDIPIVTTADTTGAKQTAKALTEITTAQNQQATSQSKLTEQTEEAGQKVGFLNLRKAELKKLTKELTHSFPELGMAIRAAMNPTVAIISLVIGLFVKAKQAIAAWNEEMDRASASAANPQFQAGIAAKKTAMAEAAKAATEFQIKLHGAGTAEDEFTKRTQASIDKLHEFVSAQAEVNNAQEAKELSEVNTGQKLGKISEIDAITKRADIKARFRKADADLKGQSEQLEVGLKSAELEHTKAQAPELEKEALARRARANALTASLAQATADHAEAEKKLVEYTDLYLKKLDEVAAAQKKADTRAGGSQDWLGGKLQEHDQAQLEKRKKELEQLGALRDQEKALVDSTARYGAKVGGNLLPVATSEANLAESRATGNLARSLSLEKDIDSLRNILPMRQAGRQKAGALKNAAESLDTLGDLAGTTQGQSLARISGDADAIIAAHGKGAGAQDARDRSGALIQQLGRMVLGQKATFEQCLSVVSKFNDTQESFKAELDRLSVRQDALQRSTMNQIRR